MADLAEDFFPANPQVYYNTLICCLLGTSKFHNLAFPNAFESNTISAKSLANKLPKRILWEQTTRCPKLPQFR